MADTGEFEKKALPQRSTRGQRMKAQLAEEEEQADAEFWNQEFFAEDARDEDYASEKEEEDVPDSDFFESESDEDDEEVEVHKEPKKKALKAPGAPPARPKAAKPPKPVAKTAETGSPSALGVQQAAAGIGELSQQLLFEVTYEAPTLRKSTRERMEVAQKEREERNQIAKAARRPAQKSDYRVLTQEELLAEAARTELENLASLKLLLAQEEETKRKANIKKQRYGGPMVKQRSRAIEVLLPAEPLAAVGFGQQLLVAAGTSAATAAAAAAGTPAATAAAGTSAAAAAAGTSAAPAAAAAGAAVPGVLDNAATCGTAVPVLLSAAATPGIDTAGQQYSTYATVAASGATAASPGVTALEVPAASGSLALPARKVQAEEIVVAALTPVAAHVAVAATAAAEPGSAANPGAALEQPAAMPTAAGEPEAQQQQQQQQSASTLAKQEITTLQCFGMKAPRWLQPQRVPPPPAKPLCAITGCVAKYKDPLTGHYYASAEAFRELRRRLGQPLPGAHKRRKSEDAAAAAGVCLGLQRSLQQAGSLAAAAGVGGFPPGEGQLLALLQHQLQQQQALVASGKGRGAKPAYQPQPGVPDEVAALVLNVSQVVHGAS